jgi:hypothetical protein
MSDIHATPHFTLDTINTVVRVGYGETKLIGSRLWMLAVRLPARRPNDAAIHFPLPVSTSSPDYGTLQIIIAL